MTTRWLAVAALVVMGGCDGGGRAGLEADAGPAPAVQCEAVHAAYARLEVQCGRPADSLYLSQAGNPADCAAVTAVTRPEDVGVCVSWLDWPVSACGELHADWVATANCLGLFVAP